MQPKRPFMKFSPGDWMINTRPLSLAAKGAWIDLLCLMWNAPNRGVLSMNIGSYARAIGATVKQTARVIVEINESDLCEKIMEEDGRITLTSSKMVVAEEIRRKRAAGGVLGGNPKLIKKVNLVVSSKVNLPTNLPIEPEPPPPLSPMITKKPCNEQEVVDYCISIGISDGAYLWDKWTGNGFQNGGKTIKDWKATIRSWKAAGYLPSQKQNGIKPMMVRTPIKTGDVW